MKSSCIFVNFVHFDFHCIWTFGDWVVLSQKLKQHIQQFFSTGKIFSPF